MILNGSMFVLLLLLRGISPHHRAAHAAGSWGRTLAAKGEGDGAPSGATILVSARMPFGMRGALERAIAAFSYPAPGRAFSEDFWKPPRRQPAPGRGS
jgi:hypothetical protein